MAADSLRSTEEHHRQEGGGCHGEEKVLLMIISCWCESEEAVESKSHLIGFRQQALELSCDATGSLLCVAERRKQTCVLVKFMLAA
ncbi:hypothetical protein PAMA_004641 [Pampus argenteus]